MDVDLTHCSSESSTTDFTVSHNDPEPPRLPTAWTHPDLECLEHVEDDDVGGELEGELGQGGRHSTRDVEIIPVTQKYIILLKIIINASSTSAIQSQVI